MQAHACVFSFEHLSGCNELITDMQAMRIEAECLSMPLHRLLMRFVDATIVRIVRSTFFTSLFALPS